VHSALRPAKPHTRHTAAVAHPPTTRRDHVPHHASPSSKTLFNIPVSQPQSAADPFAKITHHEARTSLLGGQPLDGDYAPYSNQYAPRQPTFTAPPGGYHEREGFPTALPPPVRRAPRMYIPNTKWTWSFTAIAVVQAIVALSLESYVVVPGP
jgi:hypothetical protein